MKNFITFIQQSEIADKQKIIEFHNQKGGKVFLLARDLVIWSFFGVTIDLLIISGSTVATYIDGIGWATWVPAVTFLIVNFILKACYIKWRLPKATTVLMIKGVVQYVGSILIIDHVFRENVAYRDVVKKYFTYLRDSNKTFFKIMNGIKKIVIVLLVGCLLYYGYNYLF